uniref:Uncharacterized protein n=1 Tax=Steinernema glaseri TaxID=37863 RepID=A0A1I8A8Y2_9BILA
MDRLPSALGLLKPKKEPGAGSENRKSFMLGCSPLFRGLFWNALRAWLQFSSASENWNLESDYESEERIIRMHFLSTSCSFSNATTKFAVLAIIGLAWIIGPCCALRSSVRHILCDLEDVSIPRSLQQEEMFSAVAICFFTERQFLRSGLKDLES